MKKLLGYVPGVALGAAIAVAALYLGKMTPVFNDVIIAIVIGALIRNIANIPAGFKQGLTFCLKKVLRLAIILLGIQLSFQQIVQTGGQSLLVILFVVIVAIPLTYQIGKRLGLNSHMSALLGVGSSICGASAILATGPAIKAKDGDIGLAVATIFIFNTLALFLYPILGGLMHLSSLTYGTWTGVAVQDVSSVVATGFAFSQKAGEIATIVKLTRTVLIVPVIFFVSLFFAWKNRKEGSGETDAKVKYSKVFPWFVLGFLLMAILNSFSVFPKGLVSTINPITHFLILIVMASVGTDISFREMKKTGFAFLYSGLAGMAIMSILSFVLIRVLGIGW